ncbi:zinc finger MYM-type protein 1-like [Belonocnema kinseyi]|uniref:zinc finger MYM-type protein 1-like n=1 Tax=Belonocnema kinseyi TaxID=2817044 RepID=UPI00143D1514|nr:zinc finger MYM-type protein 1-like [Belonocnema kinseyi]
MAKKKGPGKRDKFTSPSIQNEIIDACYEILTQKAISKFKTAKFYSILTDKTQDLTTIEQVTLCIRYVSEKNEGHHIVCEDFLRFIPTDTTTGQGFDEASNMSGQYKRVQAIIRNNYAPHALYVHCAAHSLNLAISITSNVPAIRDCLGTLENVYNFLHTPKRKPILENTIEESDETLRTKSLKRLNLTRWVSKYEAVNDFYELFPFVYETLDEMRTSEKEAKNLKNAMDFEFLICLHIINVIFQLSLPLSRELQRVNLDLVQAMDLAKDLREEVKRIRAKEDAFYEIYEASKKIAENLDIEIKHKRIARRQKNRANPEVQSTKDYFHVTVFNPFLDFYIMDLGERFTKHENILEGFSALFKHDLNEIEKVADKFIKTVEFYQEFLTAGPHAVLVELEVWKGYLIRRGDIKPGNSLDALDHCPEENFPNINVLLRILATLPVSTSTAERTFSSLKRIKTILRNTTKENRLNRLAALAIHHDIAITADEVIDELSKKSRKLGFLL